MVEVGHVNLLRDKLSLLVIDEKKKLSSKEVVRVSQKLDNLIIHQMKDKNGLNKQLSFFTEYL
ncbi:MAG: hypothetical protein CVU87_12530 [Firmicutes bacterium HGW-Firmicutes-12]|nr:MAG: hypothetical protein CVU87_12530 [Firmicutes bacterium HGW-Firmicutes-12]